MIIDDDIQVTSVTSLDDRRRIKSLEAQVAGLQQELSDTRARAQPGAGISHSSCGHYGGSVVDDNKQLVACASCGERLDPYVVLRRIAHREVNFCYTLNSLREETARLDAEVRRLKASRSRLKRAAREGADHG